MRDLRRLSPPSRPNAASGVPLGAVFVFALGCNVGFAPTSPDDADYAVPVITSASVVCDPERPRWEFEIETSAWTGNGKVLLSADGVYFERHPMGSVSAAADGSTDRLELKLDVTADWRDVTEGDSTVFNCGDTALVGVMEVYTRDAAERADCRGFGAPPERWADWEPDTACATPLETPDTGLTP